MITSFLNHIKKEKLFNLRKKILLTVSGGIDSIVMCELFHKADLKFGIAHCNFKLRAKESNEDETFVKTLAKKYKVPLYSISFNTESYAKKNKLSIQLAARQLRYKWFEEIREHNNYEYIATAHHLDDSIETFFINLIRGTGISGLHGILPKQGKIIRPMLFTTKKEIVSFAKKNKLKFREDSSNASDKYVRNKIRHRVTPILKQLNPIFENAVTKTINHLREVELIYRNDIETKRSTIVKQEKNYISISIQQLKTLQPLPTYLYEFLKPYNFNASNVEEIIAAFDAESGKHFFSQTHRLIKDREMLILEKTESKTIKTNSQSKKRSKIETKASEIKITKNKKEIKFDNFKLIFKSEINNPNNQINKSSFIANLDFEKLEFPLTIRKWQKGDLFYPLGMKGKKKLSDFFIDKKLPVNQKEETRLLISNGKIVWVIGHRIDNRFKITDTTQKIYIVKLI